ncbi:hypothetical protein Tco_1000073 [Tanacetum coccineum]
MIGRLNDLQNNPLDRKTLRKDLRQSIFPFSINTSPNNTENEKRIATNDTSIKDLIHYMDQSGSNQIPQNVPEYTDKRKFVFHFIEHQRLKDTPQILGNLAQKFKWVRDTAAKINIPHPPKLLKVDLSTHKKKQPSEGELKKRKMINFEQLFVTEEPKVADNERNLTTPKGLVIKDGQVTLEPALVCYLNRYNQLCFQKELEFHLASTTKLMRLHQDR